MEGKGTNPHHPWEGMEKGLPGNNDEVCKEKGLHGHNDEQKERGLGNMLFRSW